MCNNPYNWGKEPLTIPLTIERQRTMISITIKTGIMSTAIPGTMYVYKSWGETKEELETNGRLILLASDDLDFDCIYIPVEVKEFMQRMFDLNIN